MNAKELYKDKSERTQKWMQQLINTIESDGKKQPAAHAVSLEMIADAIELYFKSYEIIIKEGVIVPGHDGTPKKHPAFVSLVNQQNYIAKMLTLFGLNKMSSAKLAKMDVGSGAQDELERILS